MDEITIKKREERTLNETFVGKAMSTNDAKKDSKIAIMQAEQALFGQLLDHNQHDGEFSKCAFLTKSEADEITVYRNRAYINGGLCGAFILI